MAKSPSEQIRDLALEQRAMKERETALRDHIRDLKDIDTTRNSEIAELRKDNAELRKENADLRLGLAAARQETSFLKERFLEHLAQF